MLKPPNGWYPTIAPVHPRLKYKLPTWKSSRAFSIWSRLLEITAPVKPYSVLFAIASAWSKSFALQNATTGEDFFFH